MASKLPDVDIDCADRTALLQHFWHIPAAIKRDGKLVRHNTGVFVTDVPWDPILGHATLDHKVMDELGYFKIDFLNMSVYDGIRDEAHLDAMLARTPPWERLWTDQDFVEQIVHINGQWQLLQSMKPDSIPRLAMFLAVMRPAKRHLVGQSWQDIAAEVWVPPKDDSYFFKKSHSVAYAHLVVMHMNLVDTADDSG